MLGLQSYVAVVERKTEDNVLSVKDVHKGFMMLSRADKKAGLQARLECVKTTNPNSSEKYIFSGADFYEYVPANNTVRHHKLAKNAKGVIEQEALPSLVLGMTVEHVKGRFDLVLDKKPIPDQFHYINVRSKNQRDAQEFREARLSFDRDNHLIAEIWFRQANGNEVTWSFSQMQINVQIPAKYFQPVVPTGWQLVAVKAPLALPKLVP